MKHTLTMLVALVSLLAVLAGCSPETAVEERPWPERVEYSNLSIPTTRELADRLLIHAGVGEAERQVFFRHVEQINSYLNTEERTDGFELREIKTPKYDPYEVQDRWDSEHPDFPGYNCRITAFSLLSDSIRIEKPPRPQNSDYILLDLLALEEDPSAIPPGEELDRFRTFYDAVETVDTRNPEVHLEKIRESWQERGISFREGNASLISVFFHDQLDGDRLWIGHTGILSELDGQLYFLEKLAFQEPYQLVRVGSRAELSDYLMTKYDVEFHQPTARPLILENDHLLEGYRVRPDAD